MPDSNPHDWYEITKDIIIPSLGVAATIVIGVIVAGLLKRKEEKAKVKSLLVDSYMNFLNKRVIFVQQELDSYTYSILREICIEYESFFGKDANSHIPQKIIRERRDEIKRKLDKNDTEDGNWSYFTYQFAFLLGAKQYKKEAQDLENIIVNKYTSDAARARLIEELEAEIKQDNKIALDMNSVNQLRIEKALQTIEHKIALKLNSFQFEVFNPYDTKIADLIDQY